MFKIRGTDGKEYGPVTNEQLRQWVREGRAGAPTQVQASGATTWAPLGAVPEFAEQFATPPLIAGPAGALPPVVRTIAVAHFVAAALGAVWLLWNTLNVSRFSGISHLGAMYYFGWGVSALSVLVRGICGIGLLLGREWARRFAIGFAIIFSLYGAWGLVRTFMMLAAAGAPVAALRSPLYLFSLAWSLVLFAFNIATAILLSRKNVRTAFTRKWW